MTSSGRRRPVARGKKASKVEAKEPAASAPKVARPPVGAYLYGIIRWPAPGDLASLGAGIGDPPRPVRAISHRGVAALVSGVLESEIASQDVRGTRRDMKAHAAVLNRAIGMTTVLPVRFGVVMPSADAVVARLLEPQHAAIEAYLKKLEGAVELTLRATFVEEQVLREVLVDHPELAAGRRAAGGYQARIEMGKRISAAIQGRQEREARAIVRRLSPLVRDWRPGKPLNELPAFDRELEAIHAEAGHRLQLDCVGPLPPYSFVDLRM
jgi:hypothetical protein